MNMAISVRSLIIILYMAIKSEGYWNYIKLRGRQTDGRIEVKIAGSWGLICGTNWSMKDATVACRQLGFDGARKKSSATRTRVSHHPVLISNVRCNGTESSILGCHHTNGKDTDDRTFQYDQDVTRKIQCKEMSAASVTCITPLERPPADTSPCKSNQYLCKNKNMCIPQAWRCNGRDDCGNMEDELFCSPVNTFPNETTAVRLTGGSHPNIGRLEILYSRTWGTVCNDGFSRRSADVACRQLGFQGAKRVYKNTTRLRSGQIWMDNVRCNGNESSILDCKANPFGIHDCVHSEDVWIVCQPLQGCGVQQFPIIKSTYRIVGGQAVTKGSWPWQAVLLLTLPSGDMSFCGGVLVDRQWVLTAAHCFDRMKVQSLAGVRVRLGDHNIHTREGTEQEFRILQLLKHPNYRSENHSSDLALIELDRQANTAGRYVQKICLPKNNTEPFNGSDYCFVTGWGETRGEMCKYQYNLKYSVFEHIKFLLRVVDLKLPQSWAAALNEQLNSDENGITNGTGSGDKDSEAPSSEHSDELATSSGSIELSDMSTSSSSWSKFAQTYFQTKGYHSYSCSALPQPLLPKKEKGDHLASMASWVTILRIMGDLPDADVGDALAVAGTAPPVVTVVREYFQRKYSKKDVDETQKRYSELFKDPAHSGVSNVPFLPDRSGGMLDKVQYVTALGIYRPEIRDELYCQVCRQLTNNPSRNSTVRGWVLLCLFAGSFAPSEKFASCFLQFLKDSSPVFAEKVERLVRRTFISGTRGFPPSWLEFQAAKNGKPILIPIALMNNHRMLVTADSVTTVQELCHQICDRIGISDDSGFSVYITLMQRISCLGHGLHRIMDAVAECEQNTKQMGMRESSSAWRLYFRKEYFVPWHNAKLDEVATELVYHQVMRGISVGEYKCDKDELLVLMAAQRYFCESQDTMETMNLTTFLKSWIPEESQKSTDLSVWEEKVKQALKEEFPKGKKVTPESLRADIVTYAKDKWHCQFSRFYDASKVIGPAMTLQNGIVGVNSKQIDIMDEKENVRNHVSFMEIATINRARHCTTITTLNKEEYVIHSNHSEDLHSHLTAFTEGLKRKSKYALVVQDSSQVEGAIGVNVAKGDLIILDEPYENCMEADIITGTCKRTDKINMMPRDLLYILPTTGEPASDTMGMLTMQLKKDASVFINLSADERVEQTLEAYAKIHFRPTSDNTVTKVLKQVSFRKEKTSTSWQFSKDPIKKPLLRKTAFKEELRSTSCRCFLAIQQFMGDAPNKERIPEAELANKFVINPAIRSRHIREEIYCQVIKQLTNNPDKASVDRGFKLLYFLTSTVSPSYDLTQQCEAFLKGNKHPLAKICLDSVKKTKEDGCRRYPPHHMEYESFSSTKRTVSIQILFPFGEQQSFEIPPTIRVGAFRNIIANKLGLAVAEDYGVFFGLKERVINARETEYFMDSLTHVERFWLRPPDPSSPGPSQNATKTELKIFFLKKLWVDAVPGEEVIADINFHFPQELPNYLRGYHKCKLEEAIRLTSLLYIAQFGKDMSVLKNLEGNLSTLVPLTMHKEKNINEWKSLLQSCLDGYSSMKSEDAKIEFLKLLSSLPTYGSVFFEVKQRSVKTYPKNILLAVNKDGVIFIDASTKGILARYGYNKIPNWAYDENSFTLVVGESSSAVKIYMETNVGHNLDDIVMCYVAWMMNKHIKKRPSAAGVTVGESQC